ncbi:MAG: dual specificity protein phosphatase family protein [Pyrinomonadaceae bacterium]|nr:dual specificity protein phosphatase family protein [Pyrinomonadaceae bacterium]
MKSSIKYFLLLFIVAFANFVHAQKSVENKDLPNFSQVNAKFYRGAQPTENGVKELARMGVKTIINLRGEDKNAQKEKLWANRAGIKFIAVNLNNWFKPKTADIENIVKEIDAADNQPVFVHCKRGADRTGTVVAVYRIAHDNWTAREANDEAEKFGFGWWQFWMKDYINDYYEENGKRKTKNGK